MFREYRTHQGGIQRVLMASFAFVFLYLFFSIKVSAAPLMAPATVTGTEHHAMAWEILDIVNDQRILAGETPLVMDAQLLDYAMLRAAECVLDFAHIRPDGSNIFDDMPGWSPRGENLAAGHASAHEVMLGSFGWITSAGHWGNIMKPEYTSIGIGVFFAEGRFYYTQIFASTPAPTVATMGPATVPKTINTNLALDVSGEKAAITAGSAKTYNMVTGQQISLDLPDIYIQKDATLGTMKVKAPLSNLEYAIADPSIAQIVGTNLQTADIKALNAGITTLRIYVNGNPAKAVTFQIVVTGHSHVYTSTIINPTCTLAGYTEHTCAGCGDSYIDTPVVALGHTYAVDSTVPATCAVAGHTKYKCSDCGDTYQDPIAKLSHTYSVTGTLPATCAVAGHTEYKCSGCGDTYQDPIAKLSHTYSVTGTLAPTCTVTGHTEYTCSGCGDTYKDSIPVVAHTHVATVVAPTCTAGGYTKYTCSDCGDTYQDTTTPAMGHNYVVTIVSPPTTCMPGGFTEYECTVCAHTYQDSALPSAHSYVSAVIAPTCTVDGYTEHTCSVCGYTYQDTVVPAGHSYVSAVTAPTCTTNGYTEHTCSGCGDVYQDTIVPAGHSYVSAVIAPTCTINGYTEHTCSSCGDVYQDTIVPAGHNHVSTVIPPTCTVNGYTEHICSGCGDTYQNAVVLAAHDYKDTIVLAATCTVNGRMEHECNVCGDKPADTVIPAHGHVFGAWTVVGEDEKTQTEERVCTHDNVVERREITKTVVPPQEQGSGQANVGDTAKGNVGNNQNTGNNTDAGSGKKGSTGGKNNSGSANKDAKAPKTNDTASTLIYTFGGISAIAVIGFIVEKERRCKHK